MKIIDRTRNANGDHAKVGKVASHHDSKRALLSHSMRYAMAKALGRPVALDDIEREKLTLDFYDAVLRDSKEAPPIVDASAARRAIDCMMTLKASSLS